MNSSKNDLPEFIKGYQDQKWQLELLIAGGIIFTLYTSTDFFQEFYFLKYPIIDFDYWQSLILFGSYTLTRALLIGFGATLFLRTIWLGYTAITYWYPKGINYEKLSGSTHYKNRLQKRETARERLIRLDKWANLSFSFAIIFGFIVLIGLIVTLLAFVVLAEVFGLFDLVYSPTFNYVFASFVLLLLLGGFDFLRIGWKRKGFFGRMFNVVTSFFYYATGVFLFRPELHVLLTNGNKWVFRGFAVLYLALSLLFSINQIGEFYSEGTINVDLFDDRTTYDLPRFYNLNSNRYEEHLKEGDVFFQGGIQSELIESNYLKLFLVHWTRYDDYLSFGIDSLKLQKKIPRFKTIKERQVFDSIRTGKYQTLLNTMFTVEIDDQPIDSIKWIRYKHPKTKEEGYLTYLRVDTMNFKRHVINVSHKTRWNGKTGDRFYLSIPFWKD
ncbi:hypothetical protein ABN763_03010 [Spongiivirga sp. MCCC 1A20706]|uniref:hypothetical protein n=1 Tax=Spongiivirga sp. MCCC 1A20706 TaxID=3160963 RepID=UPI003977496D